jgi:hypothetical protein
LSKFDFIGGVFISLSKSRTYSMEDINILSVGLSSLSSQLTILNQNEHLLMISSMDQLSKLKNRAKKWQFWCLVISISVAKVLMSFDL